MKSLFQKFKGTGQSAAPAGPRIALGAFGKHPGWDDHIPGIGVETESLAAIKQTLYVGGIGSQIDSGVWEKLEPEKALVGFNHGFLVFQPGHVLFGQLWSSTDRKGRSKYPMVLCLDGAGISPGFILRELAPLLGQLRERCQATNSAEQVVAECGGAQERLRGLLSDRNTNIELPTLEDRRRFLEHHRLGPDRLGLLRVLHELGSVTAAGSRGAQSGTAHGGRSWQFRVPMATPSPNDALLLWAAFLRSAIPNSVPLLLISRDGTDWLDVIVGEPSAADFFCLRASLKALPLATEIPYDLAPDSKTRLAEVEAKFLSLSPVLERPIAAAIPPSPAPGAVQPPEGAPKGGGFKLWMVVLAVVLLGAAVAGGMWALKPRPGSSASAKPAGSNSSAPSTAAAVPVSSAPKNPVTPSNPAPASHTADVATQSHQYEDATNAARAALTQGDYRKAAEQAQIAAKARPGDAAADALLGEARQGLALADAADERMQKYTAAINAATQALQRANYDEAIKQAGAALAIKPNDSAALKIVASSRQAAAQAADAATRNEKYASAANAATQAFAAGKFDDATNQAAIALAMKPGDPAASKLMADAKQELDKKAAARKREQYEAAMNAATTAFQHGDNDTATRQIEIAAGLEPGDPAAAKLKSQVVEATDLTSAKTSFE
ncbi:MAG TPA: hypothetical protein VGJ09_00070, partial [Bryobacteraceae bacterium]